MTIHFSFVLSVKLQSILVPTLLSNRQLSRMRNHWMDGQEQVATGNPFLLEIFKTMWTMMCRYWYSGECN